MMVRSGAAAACTAYKEVVDVATAAEDLKVMIVARDVCERGVSEECAAQRVTHRAVA